MTTTNTLFSAGQGATIPTGLILEQVSASGSQQTLTSNTYNDGGVVKQTLQPGTWIIWCTGYFNPSSSSTVVQINQVFLGTQTGNSSAGFVTQEATSVPGSTGGSGNIISTPLVIRNLNVATDYYVKVISVFSVAGQSATGYFKAIRIA